jgi:hypothetical protein
MTTNDKTSVGFTFINNGLEWHGGLNYFRSLFIALQAAAPSTVQPVAFLGAGVEAKNYGFPTNVRIVQDRVFDRQSPKWVLDKLAMVMTGAPWLSNALARRQGVRVVSHGSPSGSRALRSIAWIPDFQHLHLPQFFSAAELRVRDKVYNNMLRRSDLVVVSSESARNDLKRFSPTLAAKSRVLRFCAQPPDLGAGDAADVTALYGLDGAFFYLPNQAWVHKNHMTAIRALARLARDFPEAKIVCSGSLQDHRNPQHEAALRAEISDLGLGQRFVLLGVIPYHHIAQLMLHSVAVLNPSLFEGWSTSVEEAKSLGVPLILSGIDVHREQCVRGEATFFEPLDPEELARRMAEKLVAWTGPRKLDPTAALAQHHQRVIQFARAYEAIVAEACAAG